MMRNMGRAPARLNVSASNRLCSGETLQSLLPWTSRKGGELALTYVTGLASRVNSAQAPMVQPSNCDSGELAVFVVPAWQDGTCMASICAKSIGPN
jgi:hypothetical protein